MNLLRPTRRQFLAGSAAIAVSGAASGMTGISPSFAQSNVDWKKFAGTTLEVNLIKSPRGDILQKYQKEFEDLTGIKVNSEQMPEQQQRQKAVIELTSGRPSFDVIHISYHVQKRQFEKGGWLADLNPFLKDPTLTDASLTEDDFASAGLTFAKDANGRFGALPFSVDYWIIYWNKDLFAADPFPGLSLGAVFPQTVGLGLSAAFGNGFGEIGEQYRKPEPKSDLEVERGISAR